MLTFIRELFKYLLNNFSRILRNPLLTENRQAGSQKSRTQNVFHVRDNATLTIHVGEKKIDARKSAGRGASLVRRPGSDGA